MNKRNLIGLFLLTILINACSDFIEKDLSKSKVILVAPSNNFRSSSFSMQLRWQSLNGARRYEVMVVTPNFDTINQFAIDSTVSATFISCSLAPGKYQWRVLAENNGSISQYSNVNNFYVDSVGNLVNTIVNVISPSNNSYSSNLKNTFSWQSVVNATEYRFQIFDTGSIPLFDQTTALLSISYTFPTEGIYQWKIRAQNSLSNSSYIQKTITIDTTKPQAPFLVNPPQSNDTLRSPFTLTWSRNKLEINPYRDSIYIFNDSLVFSLSQRAYLPDTSYNFSAAALNKNYFWYVKTIDKAGNIGVRSEVRKFHTAL